MLKINTRDHIADIYLQNPAHTHKLIVGYNAVIVLYLADHLLIDVDIHKLQLCGELGLCKVIFHAIELQVFMDYVIIFPKSNRESHPI